MGIYIMGNYLFFHYTWIDNMSLTIRTTNCCEIFCLKFNSMFYSSYPSIFQFIYVIKNMYRGTNVKVRHTIRL